MRLRTSRTWSEGSCIRVTDLVLTLDTKKSLQESCMILDMASSNICTSITIGGKRSIEGQGYEAVAQEFGGRRLMKIMESKMHAYVLEDKGCVNNLKDI